MYYIEATSQKVLAATDGACNRIHQLACLLNCRFTFRAIWSLVTEYGTGVIGAKAILDSIHIMLNNDDPQGCAVDPDHYQRTILLAAVLDVVINYTEITKYMEFQKRVAVLALEHSSCSCLVQPSSTESASCLDGIKEHIANLLPACTIGPRATKIAKIVSTTLGTFTRGTYTAATTFRGGSTIASLKEYVPCSSDNVLMYAIATLFGVLLMPYKFAYLGCLKVNLAVGQVLMIFYSILRSLPLFGEKFAELYKQILSLETHNESITATTEKGVGFAILILLSLGVVLAANNGVLKEDLSGAAAAMTVNDEERALLSPETMVLSWKKTLKKVMALTGTGAMAYFFGDSMGRALAAEGYQHTLAEKPEYNLVIYWIVAILFGMTAFLVYYPRNAYGLKLY